MVVYLLAGSVASFVSIVHGVGTVRMIFRACKVQNAQPRQ